MIRLRSSSTMTEFHFGTRESKFWNVIRYLLTSSFSIHIRHDSLKIDLTPSEINGVKILTKRLHHSFFASCKFDNTKSSMFLLNNRGIFYNNKERTKGDAAISINT